MPGLARPPGVGSIVWAGLAAATVSAATVPSTSAATEATTAASSEPATRTSSATVRTSDDTIVTLVIDGSYFGIRRVCRAGPIGSCLYLALYTRTWHHRRLDRHHMRLTWLPRLHRRRDARHCHGRWRSTCKDVIRLLEYGIEGIFIELLCCNRLANCRW